METCGGTGREGVEQALYRLFVYLSILSYLSYSIYTILCCRSIHPARAVITQQGQTRMETCGEKGREGASGQTALYR